LHGFAQPGPYGGSLEFKVYKNGKQIDLSAKNWKVIPNNGKFKELAKAYEYPGFYQMVPMKTPMGGLVDPDFYVDIVFMKDTMRVFTPNFSDGKVMLDSIPFKKGIYKIPGHVYAFKDLVTKNKALKYKPSLSDDWEVFATHQLESYKCYLEKIEDIEFISRRSPFGVSNEWDKMTTNKLEAFSFNNNIIMKTGDGVHYVIYEVKNFSDTTFWGEKILGNIHLSSLFQKDNAVFALVEKFYGGIRPSGTTYGIYKLHFVDESMSDALVHFLKRKQIEEDYKAITHFIERYPNPSLLAFKMDEIKTQYLNLIEFFNMTDP
jgi:hypothetical protein